MRRRQPPPRLWLMTDERQGEALWDALARLPRGAGVVFRHRATPPAERRARYERVRRIARARGLVLLLAGTAAQAARWRAAGAHGPATRQGRRAGWLSVSVHDAREARAGRRARVDLVFVSPVFATRSHPGARPLGRLRFAVLARAAGARAIALGGMDHARARSLAGAYGWAGIDAWSGGRGGQKRKAVPT